MRVAVRAREIDRDASANCRRFAMASLAQ